MLQPLFIFSGHIENTLLPHWSAVLPFIFLLLAIATGPVFFRHLWEKHYSKVSIVLGLIVAAYYIFALKDSQSILHSVTEYISFIALLSSLFVATGGISIKVSKEGTPLFNTLFLLFGAVISNLIGTTGASMLLIRPFLKINKDRIKPYHIIFFIFSVSNVGGALTPIGDPPLFLGFLRGVPFFWVIANIWYIWLPAILIILSIFYIIDKQNNPVLKSTTAKKDFHIEFKGLTNLFFVMIILLSVVIDKNFFPSLPDFSPLPFGIREIIMFAVVFLSYKMSDKEALRLNEFDFEPIKEVAYLFIGIFLTMVPALQLIAFESNAYRDYLTQGSFYWGSGTLSSFLDNAPTYLNFLSAAMGKFGLDVNNMADVKEFVVRDDSYLRAISVGAVFFGAMTYIGNGPNFMVKSISERAGIKMPSFGRYITHYSLPVLLPVFTIIWFIFFR
ncbi:MAG: sodium:proton antiporter [Ignavibacteriales bacterium]|nr:sodium:proton antiporter [Ignavibacteriales bacterium]